MFSLSEDHASPAPRPTVHRAIVGISRCLSHRHALWIWLEAFADGALNPGSGWWDSGKPGGGSVGLDEIRGARGSTVGTVGVSMPIGRPWHRRAQGKVVSWSRRVVRRITASTEGCAISRATPRSPEAPRESGRSSRAGSPELPGADDLRRVLAGWTEAMDEELKRYLDGRAGRGTPAGLLRVPFPSPGDIASDREQLPLLSSVPSADIRARACLLLLVNELVVPVLPLVDAGSAGRGQLGALVRKQRHVILKGVKLSLLAQ